MRCCYRDFYTKGIPMAKAMFHHTLQMGRKQRDVDFVQEDGFTTATLRESPSINAKANTYPEAVKKLRELVEKWENPPVRSTKADHDPAHNANEASGTAAPARTGEDGASAGATTEATGVAGAGIQPGTAVIGGVGSTGGANDAPGKSGEAVKPVVQGLQGRRKRR